MHFTPHNLGRVVLSLLLYFTLLALLIVTKAFAEERRIPRFSLLSILPENAFFSPNLKYVAVLKYGDVGILDKLEFRRYNKREKDFELVLTLPGDTTDVCALSDNGQLAVTNSNSKQIDTYDANGQKLAVPPPSKCTESGGKGNSYSSPEIDATQIRRARKILCTIPANDKIRFRHKNLEVSDIFSIWGRLPGNVVLAEVSVRKPSADIMKFSQYYGERVLVLIRVKTTKQNYCIASSLVATNDPNCALDQKFGGSESTPFIATFSAAGEGTDEPSYECSYTLTQRNTTGLSVSSVNFIVEWLVGEYSSSQVTSRFSTLVLTHSASLSEFKIILNQGCGYVITAKSRNPKLRTQAFAIGDLWCSHV